MNDKNELFNKIKDYLLNEANQEDGRIEKETKLAEKFGISRYKIRQVLNTLVQMGFLERSPRRGTTLKSPEQWETNYHLKIQFDRAGFDNAEFIEARILIECAIIPLAVRRITPSIMAKLENELKQIEENADDPLQADKHDRDFHLFLLQACGNRVLQVFSDVLVTYFERTAESLLSFDRQYFIDTAQKQREILNYIKKGEAKIATDLMREHMLEKSF